jgi:hypothetical protein
MQALGAACLERFHCRCGIFTLGIHLFNCRVRRVSPIGPENAISWVTSVLSLVLQMLKMTSLSRLCKLFCHAFMHRFDALHYTKPVSLCSLYTIKTPWLILNGTLHVIKEIHYKSHAFMFWFKACHWKCYLVSLLDSDRKTRFHKHRKSHIILFCTLNQQIHN